MVKYDANGNVIWAQGSKTVNAADWSFGYSISVDRLHNIYVCGTYQDTVKMGGLNLASAYTQPSFLIKLDSAGNAICGSGSS